MEIHTNCKICNKELNKDEFSGSDDFCCRKENHFYGFRKKDNKVTKLKIKLKDNNNYFYLKIIYDEGICEVWANDEVRHTINNIFEPDFSDASKLLTKIKTYMLFS